MACDIATLNPVRVLEVLCLYVCVCTYMLWSGAA
jgi:hypothetical protein